MSPLLESSARRGLAALRSLAETGLATRRPPRRGPVTLRRMMGVPKGTLSGAAESVASTAALLALFLAACGVMWVLARVGVWGILALVWAAVGCALFRYRSKLDFRRVADALRDAPREPHP